MAKELKINWRVSSKSELDSRQRATTPAFSRWTRGLVSAGLAAVFFGAGTGAASALLPSVQKAREAMPSRTAVHTATATDLGSPTDSQSLRHHTEIDVHSFTNAPTGDSTAAVVGDFDGDKRDDLAGTIVLDTADPTAGTPARASLAVTVASAR